MKNIGVLYHADCMDGYAAAWAVWKALGNQASYKPVRHQMPLPDFPAGAVLYIVDFCYSVEVLLKAAEKASKIVVLDHHISAQKEWAAYQETASLPDNLELNFIQEHSGCVIAWEYFHKDTEAPILLQHIEDNDLWRHKMPETQAICKALYLRLSNDFQAFEKIKLHTLQQEGRVLLKQQTLNISRLLKARHSITLNGVKGLAVNAPSMFSSDLGHELADLSGTFGLTYNYHGQREAYDCSLRSIGDFDVSQIAKQFGGGGHKNASGFRISQADFLTLLLAV